MCQTTLVKHITNLYKVFREAGGDKKNHISRTRARNLPRKSGEIAQQMKNSVEFVFASFNLPTGKVLLYNAVKGNVFSFVFRTIKVNVFPKIHIHY